MALECPRVPICVHHESVPNLELASQVTYLEELESFFACYGIANGHVCQDRRHGGLDMQILKLLESSDLIHVVGEGILDVYRISIQFVDLFDVGPLDGLS